MQPSHFYPCAFATTDLTPRRTEDATCDGMGHEQCHKASPGAADVWFIYTPTVDSCHTFTTCGTASFDTNIALYELRDGLAETCRRVSKNSTATAPEFMSCNDDSHGCGSTSDVQASLQANTTYLVQVGGGDEFAKGSGRLGIMADCGTCSFEDYSQERAIAAGACNNPELFGEICAYWDVKCPITAIGGQCDAGGSWGGNWGRARCPRSCEIDDCASSLPASASDKGVLLAALDALSEHNSGIWEGWSVDSDPCRDHWAAVRCDQTTPRRVTAFYISRATLSAVFPPILTGLSHLRILGMNQVGLSGELPDTLGQDLPLLEYLSFADNTLSGSLPSTLGLLRHLMYLDVRNNQFTGFLPPTPDWPALQNMDASLNLISGTVPDLSAGARLERFHLNANAFSGSIPQWISGMSFLQRLGLQENLLGGTIPRGFANVTTLTELHLHDNPLTGSLPSLEDLVKLKTLKVNNAGLSGTFPQGEYILRLDLLEELELGDNDLSGTLPKEIGRLRSLKSLLADDNEIKGTIPATIGQLTRLEVLNLDRNFIHGVLPMSMTKCTGLQRLQMAHNQLSGNEAATIGSVLAQMKSLTTLDIYFSSEEEDLDKTTIDPPLPMDCTVGEECLMRVITRTRDGERVAHGGLTVSVRRVNASAVDHAVYSTTKATDERDGSYTVVFPADWVVKAGPVEFELLSNDAVVKPAERRVVCTEEAETVDDVSHLDGCSLHYDATTQGALVQTIHSIGVENNGYTGGGYAVISDLGDSVAWTLTGCEEADYTLFFRYSLADGDHTCVLSIDGMPVEDMVFATTGSFSTWRRRTATIRLPEGSSTISLASMDLRSAMLYVDGMEVSAPNFAPGILQEVWFNVDPGIGSIEQFRSQEDRYPNRPTTRGETTAGMESPLELGNQYFVRMRAVFWAHETGNHSF
eukprot:COSAG06_NODE_3449_length_5328_cov_195.391745_1_plen_922_part_10